MHVYGDDSVYSLARIKYHDVKMIDVCCCKLLYFKIKKVTSIIKYGNILNIFYSFS